MSFLKVKGKDIVNKDNEKVFLRGVSFGGWLNMENFITGYIGTESITKKVIKEELGEKRYKAFFESFLNSFITEKDFEFLAELGVTAVRLPFNYRLFEDDLKPREFKKEGFKYIDKALKFAKKFNIYLILDLHAAQGWQNKGWHSDNPQNFSLFWENKDYQDRVIELWKFIASYYKDEAYIAGYDILNEPDTSNIKYMNNFYKKIVKEIRKIDSNHIIFLEGNKQSKDFEGFIEPFAENIVYSSHNYSPVTHSARRYPGPVVEMDRTTGSVYADKDWLENSFLKRNKWILDRDLPSWIGEFGALFDGGVNNPTPADKERLKALKDQLEIFNKHEQHWTIWTYKDVGVQGVVVSNKNSEYIKRLEGINNLKRELGLDGWTARGQGLLHVETAKILKIVAKSVAENLKDYSLDYSGKWFKTLGQRAIASTVENMLANVYATQFIDLTAKEIREMHEEAFRFDNLEKRSYLIDVLKEALKT